MPPAPSSLTSAPLSVNPVAPISIQIAPRWLPGTARQAALQTREFSTGVSGSRVWRRVRRRDHGRARTDSLAVPGLATWASRCAM